jgi:nucleotide-binding universal stress UspA family protein
MHLPKQILVPIDFSEPSLEALDYAIELARKVDAKITVFTSYELPAVGVSEGAFVISADLIQAIIDASESAMKTVLEERKGCGVPLESIIEQSQPWRGIVAAIDATKAELIVMGTHGRHGIGRLLLGSVAEKVVRHATCPVLTVRSVASAT